MSASNDAYGAVARAVRWACRVPAEPDPPLGSPGSLQVFRAAPAYYRYRLFLFALGQLAWLTGLEGDRPPAYLIPIYEQAGRR